MEDPKGNIPRYEDMIVRYYNAVSGSSVSSVEDIPAESLKVLGAFDYEEIIRPFVLEDLRNDVGSQMIQIRYKINRSTLRGIGRKFGFYKARCKGTVESA